jgi:hypothetical protein
MWINVNSDLLNLYTKKNRNVEYSIEQLLNSIINENTSSAFQGLSSINLLGTTTSIQIQDYIIENIKSKAQKDMNIDDLVNIFAWVAFLFPEI